MELECLQYQVADHVAHVILNRPQVLNALSVNMRKELVQLFGEIRQDPSVRVVLISGAGDRAFSAGADIKEFTEPEPLAEFRRASHLTRFDIAIGRCDKPSIAAIHGYALGGGLELAMSCDLRIASEDAQLGLTEINLGIIPGAGGTQRLPRLVGKTAAMRMILTGERVSAQEALRLGLVNEVVPRDRLLPVAMGLAGAIAAKAPVAARYAREAINRGMEMSLEDGLALEADLALVLRTTEDRLEGAKAFVEKRKPHFQGR